MCVRVIPTVIVVLLAPAAAAQTGEVYTVDNAHSIMDFTVHLLGFNRVRGTFSSWRADFYYDPQKPEASTLSFVADVASISTGNAERDADLKGATFFDPAHFPRIRFTSTSVAVTPPAPPAPGGLLVTGNLTIRDSTRQVRLPVQLITAEATDPFDNRRVAFGTSVALNRRDFGVIGPQFWNGAISDSVIVEIEVGGRVWNYSALSWASAPGKHSAGELLYAAADSNRLAAGLAQVRKLWTARQSDTTWIFSGWEFEKAAMRLAQRGRLSDAVRVLDLAVELLQDRPPEARAAVLARRGELLIRLGRRAAAADDLRQALILNPDNTNAMEWQRHVER